MMPADAAAVKGLEAAGRSRVCSEGCCGYCGPRRFGVTGAGTGAEPAGAAAARGRLTGMACHP